MATPFNLSKPDRPIRVGVILTAGTHEVLDIAPLDILSAMSREFTEGWPDNLLPEVVRTQALDVEFHWVSETGQPGRLTTGMTVEATHTFESCPPLDIVLMGACTITYIPTEKELAFVRKAYEESTAFLTICGGYDAALRAGILNGKTATAPRFMLPILREKHPETTWTERRYQQDGKFWSSGGLLNGLEMMRAFVTATWGGPGSIGEWALEAGSWPDRDVNYRDAPNVVVR